MSCLTPQNIVTEYQNIDGVSGHTVSCGRCAGCMKKRAAQWSFRLYQEIKSCDSAAFLSFTYDDENINWAGSQTTLYKQDFQLFMKRLRKNVKKHHPNNKKLKYYTVGEYGGDTKRPHYHSIIYNLPKSYLNNYTQLDKIWNNGNIYYGSVTPNSIAYVTGYVIKDRLTQEELGNRMPEFSLMSKGLGEEFLTPQMVRHLRQQQHYEVGYIGGRMSIPPYYRKKMWNNLEKNLEYYDIKRLEHLTEKKAIKHNEELRRKVILNVFERKQLEHEYTGKDQIQNFSKSESLKIQLARWTQKTQTEKTKQRK